MSSNTKTLIIKFTLTIGALEFFGPIIRDTNSSHLLNPEWIGHARFHLMWNISLWAGIGFYSLYLLWLKKNTSNEQLQIVWILQLINTFAFWNSVLVGDLYEADVFDEKIHVGFMNINENILVFGFLSLVLLFNLYLLKSNQTKSVEDSL